MPVDFARRDVRKPFTEEEMNEIRRVFRSMPSFKDTRDGRGYISSNDHATFRNIVCPGRTPEQLAVYKGYWDRHYGGMIPMDAMLDTCRAMHDTALMCRQRARIFDTNGDGYLSMTEFEEYLKVCAAHDPKLKHMKYHDLLRLADYSKDGRVSIDEFGTWIVGHLGDL